MIGTEKVDGTNARIVAMPDGGYVIGSREELLYGRGDLIRNKALGIVDALHDLAEVIGERPREGVEIYFFEVFGGKVSGASKQYTTDQSVSFRMFDAVRLGDIAPLLARSASDISLWRENGGQPFVDEATLQHLSGDLGVTLTPRLFTLDGSALPPDIAGMAAFLQEHLPKSLSTLDDAAEGKPEGIVLRTADRSVISKARFEDYARTLRSMGKP